MESDIRRRLPEYNRVWRPSTYFCTHMGIRRNFGQVIYLPVIMSFSATDELLSSTSPRFSKAYFLEDNDAEYICVPSGNFRRI